MILHEALHDLLLVQDPTAEVCVVDEFGQTFEVTRINVETGKPTTVWVHIVEGKR